MAPIIRKTYTLLQRLAKFSQTIHSAGILLLKQLCRLILSARPQGCQVRRQLPHQGLIVEKQQPTNQLIIRNILPFRDI
jgi:hypothetical protein